MKINIHKFLTAILPYSNKRPVTMTEKELELELEEPKQKKGKKSKGSKREQLSTTWSLLTMQFHQEIKSGKGVDACAELEDVDSLLIFCYTFMVFTEDPC